MQIELYPDKIASLYMGAHCGQHWELLSLYSCKLNIEKFVPSFSRKCLTSSAVWSLLMPAGLALVSGSGKNNFSCFMTCFSTFLFRKVYSVIHTTIAIVYIVKEWLEFSLDVCFHKFYLFALCIKIHFIIYWKKIKDYELFINQNPDLTIYLCSIGRRRTPFSSFLNV